MENFHMPKARNKDPNEKQFLKRRTVEEGLKLTDDATWRRGGFIARSLDCGARVRWESAAATAAVSVSRPPA
jgi:hypothetical protein